MIYLNNAFKKRIDELGRIVIPKQLRKTLKIGNFEELDLYIDGDNIVIKKCIGLRQYEDKLSNLLNVCKCYPFDILIVENNKVVVSNSLLTVIGERLILDYVNLSKENKNNNILLKDDTYNIVVRSLIYDSSLLGYLVCICKDLINVDDVNNIKNTVINLLT